MIVTYLVNKYPAVSHTFIRREIAALENKGLTIHRVSIRGWEAGVVDELDKIEQLKTDYLLLGGIKKLLISTCKILVKHPFSFVRALKKVIFLSSGSEKNLLYHIAYLLEACKLVELCEKRNTHHVHAHFGTNSAEVVYLTHILGRFDYSLTIHGSEEFDNPKALHLKEKIKHAKFIVAVSHFTRSQLFRWCEYSDWSKIHVVHCGLEQSFFEMNSNIVRNSSTHCNLLCIGRLCEQKGQLLLIEAIKKIIDKRINVHLTLAGDGDMRTEIEMLVYRYNLRDFISITGWVSSIEVKRLLQQADAMILPSLSEGLPVAIMEAMACKTAVLTTYIAGIPELIQSGINGWLFPAGSVDHIVLAIEDFCSTPDNKLNLILDSAHHTVSKQHSIDMEAEKLKGLFQH